MKQLIIASILLLITIVGIFIAEKWMNNESKYLSELCNKLIEEVEREDVTSAGETLSEIENSWEKSKAKILILLNHSDIDNVDSAIRLTRASVAEWDKDICLQNASLLRFYIDELLDTEEISLENIL